MAIYPMDEKIEMIFPHTKRTWTSEDIGKKILCVYDYGTVVEDEIVEVKMDIPLVHPTNGMVTIIGNSDYIIGPKLEVGMIIARFQMAEPVIEVQRQMMSNIQIAINDTSLEEEEE
tara:strand:- start:32 stop:379 length:348 start_codon:yes stop_codon:yes gene_type:complete